MILSYNIKSLGSVFMECHKCHHEVKKGQEVCLNCGHILGYESLDCLECPHCNRSIPVNSRKCPFCKKTLIKSRKKKAILITLLFSFITFLCLYSLYGTPNERIATNYKEQCIEINYEKLIRKADYYNRYNIYFEGKIKSITTVDKRHKIMEMEIITDNNTEHLIDIEYRNTESLGYMVDDEVIIYGKYLSLNGNIPYIKAKYIEIKKAN